jgi:hypothetical protein
VSRGRLCTLCELEWPTFGVNWTPEGTLDLPTGRAIYRIIIGTPRHPISFCYIDSWLQVAQTMPPLVQFCANKKGQNRVFMAQVMKPKDQKLTKPVLQGDPEDEPPVPLPYIPRELTLSEQPVPSPRQSATFSDSPQPHQQPPSHSDVPHPSLAWSLSLQSLSHCLHSSQVPACQDRALQMPLCEMQGPWKIAADHTVQPGQSTLYYQPFSTTNLLNWRSHTPPYSEEPQAMVNVLEFIFQIYHPTWDDCQQITLTFFDTEEQR